MRAHASESSKDCAVTLDCEPFRALIENLLASGLSRTRSCTLRQRRYDMMTVELALLARRRPTKARSPAIDDPESRAMNDMESHA